MRWQQLYEQTILPGDLQPGTTIIGLGWRRCGQNPSTPAATLDTEIGIYDVSFGQAGMSPTFAVNRAAGTGRVVFTRKRLDLPAVNEATNPLTSFHIVPLDAPHSFVGPNLMVEVVNWDSSSRSTGWMADMFHARPNGQTFTFGTACGAMGRIASVGALTAGSTFLFTQTFGPPRTPAFLTLGFDTTALAGVPLPVELSPIGAPGCTLYQSADIQVPVTLDARGAGSVPVRVPGNAGGATVVGQWINLVGPSPLGASFSKAHQVRIGPAPGNGAYVSRLDDNEDTTGVGPAPNRGQVLRLIY